MPFVLKELVKNPDDIPSLPQVYYQITDAINDPDATLDDIGEIIISDMALTTRLLKLVNSSFYGFSSKVETISHALNIIGTAQLTNLILSTMVISKFKNIPEKFVTMQSFWAHGIACGLAAKEIAASQLPQRKEVLYIAGMIHDIGSLIIYKEIPDQAKKALEQCNEQGQSLVDAEKSVMGFDHAEVGGAILTEWALPEFLREVVTWHHAPMQAPNFRKETAIIHVADYIVKSNQLGSSGELQSLPLEPELLEFLSLTTSELSSISQRTIKLFEEAIKIFSD